MKILEVTTMIGCPLMCTFCPQSKLKQAYGQSSKYLDPDDFKRVLKKIPTDTTIHFSGMSEPWANPKCTEMLRLALCHGFRVTIYSTLYGIDEENADLIVSLLSRYHKQVDHVCLHLPDANNNIKGWRHSAQWELVFSKFREFAKTGLVSNFRMMTMDGQGQIHPSLAHLNIDVPGWQGHSRAGNLDNVAVTPLHTAPVRCGSTPLYDHNVLLPDGRLVLCCMDYGLQHVLGNLFTQEYDEIFRGQPMADLKRVNSEHGYSKYSICKNCSVARPIGDR